MSRDGRKWPDTGPRDVGHRRRGDEVCDSRLAIVMYAPGDVVKMLRRGNFFWLATYMQDATLSQVLALHS